MGNKSSNKNNKNTNDHKKEVVEDIIDKKSIIKNINENRKNELIDFLLSNVTMTEEYQKSKDNLIKNESLFLLFISNFNEYNGKENINSHFIPFLLIDSSIQLFIKSTLFISSFIIDDKFKLQ